MTEDVSSRLRMAKRLAVLIHTAHRGRRRTLREWARRFDCSTRTIRRDVAVLYQAGVIGRHDLVTIREPYYD